MMSERRNERVQRSYRPRGKNAPQPETQEDDKPLFFENWEGQTAVICASGPSQKKADIEACRGRARVVTINETWRLAPWCDVLYACDERWWKLRGPDSTQFSGIRVQGFITKNTGRLAPGCRHGGVRGSDNRVHWRGNQIGAGGNSGFQALNWVARCGAKKIILLGYDFGYSTESHWHGEHGAGMTNPKNGFLARCANVLDKVAQDYKFQHIQVINASRQTRLQRYPRMTIEEALDLG